MICVIHAHPYQRHSRATRALLEAIRPLPDLEVRSLYDLYPDFDIDVVGEQDALARALLLVWLHPFHWFGVPGLMKHWLDKVLERGWAYGAGGTALAGKHCLWAPTIGSDADTYAQGRENLRPFAAYVEPIEQTARFCGMKWEAPYPLFGSLSIADDELAAHAEGLRARLEAFAIAHDWREPAGAEDFAS
jgi:glutathione-regulated potassium-efflux system ancillary protein KefF